MSLKWHERLSVRAIEFHQSLRRHLQPFLRPGASSVLIIGSVYAAAQLLKSLAEEARKSDITLLCVEKDEAHCHRSLLKLAIERYARD